MRKFALIMGARFFNRPKNESRFTNHEPRAMSHKPRTTNHASRVTIHEPQTTIHDPRFTLHEIAPLHLSRALYKSTLFMQNKPNFQKAKMNVSSAITMNYEQLTMNYANKNKPKQSQFARG